MFVGLFIPAGLASYPKLTGNSKLVWGQLASYAGDRGIAWPSYEKLAKDCGISRRSIQACLVELQERAFIICVGIKDRRKMWGFLWHPCLEGSVRNLPTSTLPSRQNLPTTPEAAPEDSPESSKCADSAHDSRQNLPMIVGKNCSLPVHGTCTIPSLHEAHEGVHEGDLSSTLRTSVGVTCDSPPNARAPDDLNPLFESLWIPAKPGDSDRANLHEFIDHNGSDVIREYLTAAARTKTCRGRRVISYLRKCIENRPKGVNEDGSGGNYKPDEYGL
ncbi:helix-turn-helix domain-containing protein [bacterium]|nr:helix-turn-helix domain-containing protein [bacterium]